MWVLGCHSRPVHCNSQPVFRRMDEVTLAFFKGPHDLPKKVFFEGRPISVQRDASRKQDRSIPPGHAARVHN